MRKIREVLRLKYQLGLDNCQIARSCCIPPSSVANYFKKSPGGEKMFVDIAGSTVPVVHPDTGVVQHASILVAVLGASNYPHAASQREESAYLLRSGHTKRPPR